MKSSFLHLKLTPQKFRNMKEYKALYPEYKFVLVGDNGQADGMGGVSSESNDLSFVAFLSGHIGLSTDPRVQ